MEFLDISTDWQAHKSVCETNRVLLEKEIATDVRFIFPKHKTSIKAHRLILLSRSRAFYVMFHTGPKIKFYSDITIDDVEPTVFWEMLMFLYCEELNLKGHNVLSLMRVAEKYKLKDLQAKCLDFLKSDITPQTVWGVLEQAKQHENEELVNKCLTFLNKDPSVEGLKSNHVGKETLEILVDFDVADTSEVAVFQACYEWANKECERNGLEANMQNRRAVLGTILAKIRFCSMSSEEFAENVSDKEILTFEEEVRVLRYLCKPPGPNPPFPNTSRAPVTIYLDHKTGYINFIHSTLECNLEGKILGFIPVKSSPLCVKFNDQLCDMSNACANKPVYFERPIHCGPNIQIDIRGSKIVDADLGPKPRRLSHNYDIVCGRHRSVNLTVNITGNNVQGIFQIQALIINF